METEQRFLQAPAGSFFLFGPRGTGKSTWLNATFPAALKLDLLDPESQRLYQARPERLLELVAGHPDAGDVVIDEIQKVPVLLDVIHQLLETRSPRRYILTGSSARKLRRGAVNLLAGRLVCRNADERLYYWRTKSGSEVDFVVYGPETFAAWEVKRASQVQAADLRALKSFREDYPEATVGLLYLGQERLRIDGIDVWPCETFIRQLA